MFEATTCEEKHKKFGVQCLGEDLTEELIFHPGRWRPNGEFSQRLTIKNISTTVKKLKYKLPKGRYFDMPFPEIISLSPGISKTIDVFFRPQEYRLYEDFITIMMQGGEGEFKVKVSAQIEKLKLECTPRLEFGYCPAFQWSEKVIQLKNTGQIDGPFRWEMPETFVIDKKEGIVAAGKTVDIKISIFPDQARVYVVQAVCHVGENIVALNENPCLTLKLSAICKFTHLSLSEPTIDFGEVVSGTPSAVTQKDIVLRNSSVVPCEFKLHREDESQSSMFSIRPESGVIAPESEIIVSIRYTALSMGFRSLERFIFQSPSKAIASLECRGISISPLVEISKYAPGSSGDLIEEDLESSPLNALNFRDAELGTSKTRVLYFKNKSTKAVNYSVAVDDYGIFRVNKRKGTIPANTTYFPVQITFIPKDPINYVRRVFILIGESHTQFVDVFGSGFIRARGASVREQRPFPIRFAHIQAYRNREVDGIGNWSAEELDNCLDNGSMRMEYFASVGMYGTTTLKKPEIFQPLSRDGSNSRSVIAPSEEFFRITSKKSEHQLISINCTELDFGFVRAGFSSSLKEVVLTNNTHSDVSVSWVSKLHPASKINEKTNTNSVSSFVIEPKEEDIPPGGSKIFRISYAPTSKQIDSTELEAYVYFSNQKSFRSVNDATLTPPWHIPLRVIGYSDEDKNKLALKCKFTGGAIREGTLVFAPCYHGDAMMATITLTNPNDHPVIFNLNVASLLEKSNDGRYDHDHDDDDVFEVKPSKGLIEPRGFEIIMIRFKPNKEITNRRFEAHLTGLINDVPNGLYPLKLIAQSFTPALSILDLDVDEMAEREENPTNNKTTYFQPTCIGRSTTRKFRLKNDSMIPLRYLCKMLGKDGTDNSDSLQIAPNFGFLNGNEIGELSIQFKPIDVGEMRTKISVEVFPISGKANEILDCRQIGIPDAPEIIQVLDFDCLTVGESGTLEIYPRECAFETRLVGKMDQKEIWIENMTSADVTYTFYYQTIFLAGNEKMLSNSFQTGFQRVYRSQKSVPIEFIQKHSLFCENCEGTLPARSKRRLVFTFMPHSSGHFDFNLFSIMKSTNLFESNAIESEGINNVTMELEEYWGSSDNDSLKCHMFGNSGFPTLSVIDLQVLPDTDLTTDISHFWESFDLKNLNGCLAMPPNEDELKIYNASNPDLSLLDAFEFEFPPAIAGSAKKTINLEVKNTGFLSASYEFLFPNEKTMDLEQWCDEEKPSEELNEIISIIEELKCFSIEPRKAILEPGQSIVLSVSYTPKHFRFKGIHRLPLTLKIEQGKLIRIVLRGQTLLNNDALGLSRHPTSFVSFTSSLAKLKEINESKTILLPAPEAPDASMCTLYPTYLSKRKEIVLAKVPIGLRLETVPEQRIEIVNPSSVAVFYSTETIVDLGLKESVYSSNGFDKRDILRISNPSGIIAANSSTFLICYFFPLVAAEHKWIVRVEYRQVINDNPSRSQTERSTESNQSHSTISKRHPSKFQSKLKKKIKVVIDQIGESEVKFSLDFFISASGFDPRYYAKEESDRYIGERAPLIPSLIANGVLVEYSTSLFDFQVMPQHTVARRLLFLRNISEKGVEFSVLPSRHEDLKLLLLVTPMSGLIAPGDSVCIDLTFQASHYPVIISDYFSIRTREVIKAAARRPRRGSSTTRLLNSQKRKQDPEDRNNLILRSTSSVDAFFSARSLNSGRIPHLPSSINSAGRLEEGTTIKSENSNSEFAHFDSKSEDSLTHQFSNISRQDSFSEFTADASSLNDNESIYSSASYNDKGSQNLYGEPKHFNIRIKASVVSLEALKEFREVENWCSVKPFFIPPVTTFIPRVGVPPPARVDSRSNINNGSKNYLKDIQSPHELFHSIFQNLFCEILNTENIQSQIEAALNESTIVRNGLKLKVDGSEAEGLIPPHIYFDDLKHNSAMKFCSDASIENTDLICIDSEFLQITSNFFDSIVTELCSEI